MTKFENILYEVAGGVATLTLNLPDIRNPISDDGMVDEIVAACGLAQDDRGVNVLIITGAGPAFCAGGNVKVIRERAGLGGGSPARVEDNYRRGIQRIPLAVHNLDIPTIAAVNGAATGAGCDLALMCDIRIGSTAARFSEPFVNLGLIPGDGGGWFLPRRVGQQRAAELLFTGRFVEADEALDIGMVLKLVPPQALMDEARALAATIAGKPPQAIRFAKRLLRHSERLTLSEFLDLSAAQQALAHHTNDHIEAIESFFEKRPGNFTGE